MHISNDLIVDVYVRLSLQEQWDCGFEIFVNRIVQGCPPMLRAIVGDAKMVGEHG